MQCLLCSDRCLADGSCRKLRRLHTDHLRQRLSHRRTGATTSLDGHVGLHYPPTATAVVDIVDRMDVRCRSTPFSSRRRRSS